MQYLTVALDAMGGDFGPCVTVPAAVQALLHFPELNVILVGDQTQITHQLPKLDHELNTRLSIVHCDRVISNSEKPSSVLRHSDNTSMRVAIDLVSERKADACVSAGNTGALMALSRFRLKLLPGIERPALVSILPSAQGKCSWMLDLGANVSSNADALFQFAVMGSALAEEYLKKSARVAILNIGSEDIKGNDVVKRCADMLTQTQSINYIGYIEGNQLFDDVADVIVCDGFVGNVCLKATEGTAQFFINKIKGSLLKSPIKSWLAQKLFSTLFNELKVLKPDQYNGASLLGLRGIVIKSHGNADASAIMNAIKEAVYEVQQQIPSRINDRLETILLERH